MCCTFLRSGCVMNRKLPPWVMKLVSSLEQEMTEMDEPDQSRTDCLSCHLVLPSALQFLNPGFYSSLIWRLCFNQPLKTERGGDQLRICCFSSLFTLIDTLTALHFSYTVLVGSHASYATMPNTRVFAPKLWQCKVVTGLSYTLLGC